MPFVFYNCLSLSSVVCAAVGVAILSYRAATRACRSPTRQEIIVKDFDDNRTRMASSLRNTTYSPLTVFFQRIVMLTAHRSASHGLGCVAHAYTRPSLHAARHSQ